VVAAGKSGFPELPTVSAMLDASTQTLSRISKQAQKLQQQMLDVQQDGDIGVSTKCSLVTGMKKYEKIKQEKSR